MLRTVHDLRELTARTDDGEVGRVDDVYFDDQGWAVRYLVVDAGKDLPGRQVLVSPVAASAPDWAAGVLPVRLTLEQIRQSPDAGTERPVSRQHEASLATYYGWPSYWAPGPFPGIIPPAPAGVPPTPSADRHEEGLAAGQGDPHLRSAREVTGYHIEALDDSVGHVEDLVLDVDGWAIRYLLVDTRNWLPGRKVLVAPQWASQIRWADRKVRVELDRDTIRNAPAYDPKEPLERRYEQRLHAHYGRRGYWG